MREYIENLLEVLGLLLLAAGIGLLAASAVALDRGVAAQGVALAVAGGVVLAGSWFAANSGTRSGQ